VHTHATHGHAHGHAHDHGGHGHGGASPDDASSVAVSIRHRAISQVSLLPSVLVQINHSHFLVPKENTRKIWYANDQNIPILTETGYINKKA